MATGPLFASQQIIQRLSRRYNLQVYPQDPNETIVMAPVILPVTDIDALLIDWDSEQLANFSRRVVAGAGLVTAWTNNTTYLYRIRAISISRAAGDGTMIGIYHSSEAGVITRVYTIAAAAGIDTVLLSQDVYVDRGQKLQVNIAAITGDSIWAMTFYRAKESSHLSAD